MNPAFKRKSTSEDVGSAKKLPKKEDPKHKDDSKGKENGQKENLKLEKETKPEAAKPVIVPEEEKVESMEVDSPVKSLKKKKKCVIDSDSEEESPKKASDEAPPAKKKAFSPEKSPVENKIGKENEIKSNKVKKTQGSPKVEKSQSSPKKKEKSEGSPKTGDKSQSSPEKLEKTENSPKKTEKKTMSNFFTPKSAKVKPKVEKAEDKEVEEKVGSTGTDVKEGSSKAKDSVSENKPKAAFAGFFSPKSTPGSAKRNEGGADYEKKVLASSYHPVDDSFWNRDEATPFLALAKTLESIEATSSRLKTIEVLSNYLRSVMVQTPADLQPSVYMTLNRLAPAWEGIELGIGDSLLIKAIANSTGRSAAQIKTDMGKLGDLGLVAEQSRGGQRTMFQPKQLTVQAVFEKLREIASLTGHSSGTKKVEKIQALLVACRGSEARWVNNS